MRWFSTYCLEVIVDQILVDSLLFKDMSDMFLFPANIGLFQGYSTPNFG